MLGARKIGIANDNDPADRFPRGDAVGFRAALVEKQRAYNTNSDYSGSRKTSPDLGLNLSIVLWLFSIIGFSLSHFSGQSIALRLLTCLAVIWTGLWQAYLSHDRGRIRLGEVSVLTAIIGFVVTLITATTYLGLPVGMVDGLCIFSMASLTIAILLRSPTALIASISACMCWAALHFDGYITPTVGAALLPGLLCLQILYAAKLRSHPSILAGLAVCYLWLIGICFTMVLTGQLSPLYAAAVIFLGSSLHYRGAKAAEDEGLTGMSLHILIAWSLSILSLIAIQYFYLYPDHKVWAADWKHSAVTQLGWIACTTLSIAMIFVCGVVRRRHGHMTYGSILLMTLSTLAVPALVLCNDQASMLFEQVTGLPAFPNIGLVLSGIVLAAAFMFVLNTLRRGRYIICLTALLLIGIQADFVLKSDVLTPDGFAMIGIGSLLAVTTLSMMSLGQFDPHHRPLKTLAHK